LWEGNLDTECMASGMWGKRLKRVSIIPQRGKGRRNVRGEGSQNAISPRGGPGDHDAYRTKGNSTNGVSVEKGRISKMEEVIQNPGIAS